MSDEQAGPPTDEQRGRRDTDFVRTAQIRFRDGYLARLNCLHPMRKNARGEELQSREPRWSYAESAAERCPKGYPTHEGERWIAGFLHADKLGSEQGVAAMERGDPGKPPPRPQRAIVATQEDGFAELSPPLARAAARDWWERHRGSPTGHTYRDAGEQ